MLSDQSMLIFEVSRVFHSVKRTLQESCINFEGLVRFLKRSIILVEDLKLPPTSQESHEYLFKMPRVSQAKIGCRKLL